MLVNICMKFHEGTLNGILVTKRTRPYRKIYYFQFQRAMTPKIRNPELRFMRSARHLMLLYMCVKRHENISSDFLSYRADKFCDRQTARANNHTIRIAFDLVVYFHFEQHDKVLRFCI